MSTSGPSVARWPKPLVGWSPGWRAHRLGLHLVGVEFTRFAWYRISELAELPLWLIHIAWPLAGVTWIIFLGEQMSVDDLLPTDPPRDDPVAANVRRSPVARGVRPILFGVFFC